MTGLGQSIMKLGLELCAKGGRSSCQPDSHLRESHGDRSHRFFLSLIGHGVPCKFRALTIIAALPPPVPPHIRLLFVRPALCLRFPPDFRSPSIPLPFG